MKTLRVLWAGCALAMLSLALFAATPATAQAVELYWDPSTGQVVRRPTRYLYVQTQTQQLPPPRTVTVYTPPAPTSPVYVVTPTPAPEPAPRRDPYATSGRLLLGTGAGALVIFGDGDTYSTPSYRIHVGAAMDQAEFSLRFDLAPRALDVEVPDGGGEARASLYTAGAGFGYRLFPNAFVHPVVGVGLETLFLNPEGLQSSRAFAATGRMGLELAVPVGDDHAIALGLDVTGHLPFVTSRGWLGDRTAMVGFGLYGDWRF